MNTAINCKSCNAILGFRHKPKLYLQNKKSKYIIEGSNFKITAVCHRCSSFNEITCRENQTLKINSDTPDNLQKSAQPKIPVSEFIFN